MRELNPDILSSACQVRMILLDADGVLTDGRIYMGPEGGEIRAFDVTDGLGIKLGQEAGLIFGIISGRESAPLAARAAELQIRELHQRVSDKVACFEEIIARLGFTEKEVCFVGDDLIDLPLMRRVGLAVAPCDASSEARECARYVTTHGGGRGAVREVVDLVLRAGGKWESTTRRFFE